jgi:hypothetical protein
LQQNPRSSSPVGGLLAPLSNREAESSNMGLPTCPDRVPEHHLSQLPQSVATDVVRNGVHTYDMTRHKDPWTRCLTPEGSCFRSAFLPSLFLNGNSISTGTPVHQNNPLN